MTLASDPNTAPQMLLRRLARENRAMGPRLAELEFRDMLAELSDPKLFDLEIDFPGDPASLPPAPKPLTDDPFSRLLPRLDLTLGKIAWVENPRDLPAMGIYCPDTPGDVLRDALRGLMTEHHSKPFARLVFLCESFRPIPFLGRYGLTYEHLGAIPVAQAAARLYRRFGIVQMRDILTGGPIWRAPQSEEIRR